MPIPDFAGDCFVAFTDISGFKVMMKDGKKAVQAIDRLYTSGFDTLKDSPHVNGFFISDCGILFTPRGEITSQLANLLSVINRISRELLRDEIMLTTSIAWGQFSYHNRIEFPGIKKQPIYGNAYLAAFLDNETGSPRIQPGQCRVIDTNLPDNAREFLAGEDRVRQNKAHHYYYWMVDHEDEIDQFSREYSNSYSLKYAGMLSALRNATG